MTIQKAKPYSEAELRSWAKSLGVGDVVVLCDGEPGGKRILSSVSAVFCEEGKRYASVEGCKFPDLKGSWFLIQDENYGVYEFPTQLKTIGKHAFEQVYIAPADDYLHQVKE